MARFDGKVALITGGGRGIGNRDAEQGRAAVRQVQEQGGAATFLRTDVAEPGQIEALVDHAVKTYGRLDVAFNNAAINGAWVPLAEETEEQYQRVMDVNTRGVWLLMKHEIPAMLKSGGGSIINTTSVAGSNGFPTLGIYVASKHAVVGLTKTAALELARSGNRVNCVSPAGIDTEMLDRVIGDSAEARAGFEAMHPVGRIGRVEEVASAVTWLAAGESSFVTGHDLLVDGGMTAR